MPAVFAAIPGILAAIGGGSAVAGGATAASLALGATELVKSLTSSQPKASPFPSSTEVTQNKNQLASIVQQNLGNLQEAGGGGLSPNYDANVIGSSTGTLGSTNTLQDLITAYLNGNPSGGGTGGGGGSTTPSTDLAIPAQSSASLNSGPGLVDTSIFA